MKTSPGQAPPLPRPRCDNFRIFVCALGVGVCLGFAGCGTPNAPAPPRQPVPQAVTDLAARQLGDGVALTFTLPKKAIDGVALDGPPAVEIYRGSPAAGGNPNAARLVYTIPAAMVNDYLTGGRIEFRDPLPQEDVSNPLGQPLTYSVRTRASKKHSSADSNAVSLRVFPTPQAISDVQPRVTENAVELYWTSPAGTLGGASAPAPAGYHIYRAELESGAVAPDSAKTKRKTPLELLGPTDDTRYRDQQFEFGHTYVYFVRSVVRYASEFIESADSNPAVVAARDVFPPAPPKNLVAIAVPAVGDSPAHLELSWSIGEETDLAGYNVYRSEGTGSSTRGEKLNQELLLAPAFRDLTAVSGRRYTYRVTAVDRTGNESESSEAVAVDFTPRTP